MFYAIFNPLPLIFAIMIMVYHGILWESMGIFSILLTVLGMFCCCFAVY